MIAQAQTTTFSPSWCCPVVWADKWADKWTHLCSHFFWEMMFQRANPHTTKSVLLIQHVLPKLPRSTTLTEKVFFLSRPWVPGSLARNTIFTSIFRPRSPLPTLMSRPLMMPSWNSIPAHQAQACLIFSFSQWCPVVVCKEVCKVFSHFSSWRMTHHLPVFSVMTTAFSLWWWWVAKTVWLQSWDKYSLRLANVSRDTFVHLRVLTWRHPMTSSVLFCAFNC